MFIMGNFLLKFINNYTEVMRDINVMVLVGSNHLKCARQYKTHSSDGTSRYSWFLHRNMDKIKTMFDKMKHTF